MENKLIANLREVSLGIGAAALVTIIKTKGSTPRKAGAKMLVTPEGHVFGTIGGGCGEAEVKREALDALQNLLNSNTVKTFKYIVNMTQDMAAEEGMVCGGIMEVIIELLPEGKNKEKKFILDYLEALENNEKPKLITLLPTITIEASENREANLMRKIFTTDSCRVVTIHDEDKALLEKLDELLEQGEVFIESAPSTVELIILGGGHIALPLCNIGKTLGYHVTVIDDRPLFANGERFNQADKVICDTFVKAIEGININRNSFVVIVTRGHRHDRECLETVIKKPAFYIGMIGSKRRVKALMTELLESGAATKEQLAKIHSPIGLEIGAEAPEEIAVSILAEIIKVHREEKQDAEG